jgi:hypothetical protein
MIRFKREACRDVEAALQREWLETNGLGGFASSTIIGLNTRRYHGLLVVATKPPRRPFGSPLQARRDAIYRWEGFRPIGQPLSRCYSPAGIPLSHTVSSRPVSGLYV